MNKIVAVLASLVIAVFMVLAVIGVTVAGAVAWQASGSSASYDESCPDGICEPIEGFDFQTFERTPDNVLIERHSQLMLKQADCKELNEQFGEVNQIAASEKKS